MARADLVRRSFKLLAAVVVVIGLLVAAFGTLGGLEMGGAILQGDIRGDAHRLTLLILPIVAACVMVFGTSRDRNRPAEATAIYGGVVILIAIQLASPALP